MCIQRMITNKSCFKVKEMKLSKKKLYHFLINTKLGWKNQRKTVILSLVVFVSCIKNVAK